MVVGVKTCQLTHYQEGQAAGLGLACRPISLWGMWGVEVGPEQRPFHWGQLESLGSTYSLEKHTQCYNFIFENCSRLLFL